MLKYCSQCGNKLNEGEKFCSSCGHKVINSEPAFNDAKTQFNKSNDNVPPPPPPFNKAKDDVPPPPSSSNNAYSKEEPYNEPSFNNTPPNVNPNKNNNSTYNKNVVQAKTSSNTKFIAIASIIVATLIILSVGGYLYFKWKNIKENTSSAQSSSITNTDSKNSSNNAANNGTANNNNSANNNVSDVSNKNKDNTSSNNLLSDDMIKDYIALADSTSLNLFKLASEAEQNGQAKQSFASIRPLLQNCYSDAIVDGELKPFYESELGQWTYELGMAFPFYSKAYFDQCTFTVTQRTESIVQVKIIDNNPEPLVSSTYTLKRYDKIWKIENVQIITND